MSRVRERERVCVCVCVCVMRPRSRTRTREDTEREHERQREGKRRVLIEAHAVLIREKKENRKKRTNPRTDRRLDGSQSRMFVGRSRGVESTRKGRGEMGQTVAWPPMRPDAGFYINSGRFTMYVTRPKRGG